MSEIMKVWLGIAALLVVIGLVVFALVMSINGWDFTKLGTGKYKTNIYEATENFDSIFIKADTADIVFVPFEEEAYKVVCYEAEKTKHSVRVEDGVLTIEVVDTRKWYDYIGIQFESPSLTVYLPEKEYSSLIIEERTGDVEIPKEFRFAEIDISVSTGDVKCCAFGAGNVKIATTTGDIAVESTTLSSLDLSVSTGTVTAFGVACTGEVRVGVSTGKVHLSDMVCQSLMSSGSTGNIALKRVIVEEKLLIDRSTGDVWLEESDAAEIFIETDTGDVKGSLLSEKVFIVRTDTGRMDVPKTVTGGRCEITTDTGDIKISLK